MKCRTAVAYQVNVFRATRSYTGILITSSLLSYNTSMSSCATAKNRPCFHGVLYPTFLWVHCRGLGAITAALLTSRGDVRLQCKAANALGSLCMSEHVASTFLSNTSSSAVLDRFVGVLHFCCCRSTPSTCRPLRLYSCCADRFF